ncbi:GCN5 family acetyltransferase [Flavobacterium sp. 316]|uniref:GNAT family N-acetyltransferase n=1 Tax=Flavobacterium sp. 316 TaxID=1603293 RepID=UPI0005E01A00|nr:GNAT family N-acetyltransferase [Flavobacterium sp. 316]KIX22725.1 GCN5 family acetyltransferase [Flavobacterium sp. 316]
MFRIDTIQKSEYLNVIAVWEASVRATHHFLKEEDIQYFKPLILNNYLDAVELRSARNEQNEIIGFLGVAEQNLEMLFIHPTARGIGIGKKLLHYAINELKITNVDVNEQNEQAVGFYKHFGFEIIDRSELDFSGKPFPILYMKLKKQT